MSKSPAALVAYHNINSQKLSRALELGGFAMPSLAITRTDIPFEKFGRITFVAPISMIHPRNSKLDFFSRDAYTVRVPSPVYRPLKKRSEKELYETYQTEFAELPESDRSAFAYEFQENPFQTFVSSAVIKLAYLHEQGLTPPIVIRDSGYGTYLDTNATFRPYQDFLHEDYQEFARHRFEKLAGPPVVEVGRRKLPYTLENVVNAMRRFRGSTMENGPSNSLTDGEVAAMHSFRIKNQKDLVKAAALLDTPEAVDAQKDAFFDLGTIYVHAVLPYYQGKDWRGEIDAFCARDEAAAAVANLSRMTKEALQVALVQNGFQEVPEDALEKGLAYARMACTIKTEYLEAVLLRGVKVKEFTCALIPNNLSPKLLKKLQEVPIKTFSYDPMKEGDRQQQLKKIHQKYPETVLPLQKAITR